MSNNADGRYNGMWWLQGGAPDLGTPEPPEEQQPKQTPPRRKRPASGQIERDAPPPPSSAQFLDQQPPSVEPAGRQGTIPPPPPPPASAMVPRRRRPRWRLIAGICALMVLALVSGGLVYLTVTGNGHGLALSSPIFGFGQPQATPTYIGFARSAKITFTPLSQAVTAPATLVASTDGKGDITAKQVSTTATGTSAAHDSTYKRSSQVIFNITVTNNTNNDLTSAAGQPVTSNTDDGTGTKVSCQLGPLPNNGLVSMHSSVQQLCSEPIKPEPAASWNYTDPGTGLVYSLPGQSPAGGNPAGYTVPDGCGADAPKEAQGDAQSQLQKKLAAATPAGSVVFYQPTLDINAQTLACVPAAGTFKTTTFSYTATINGSGALSYFLAADAQAFATARLPKAVPDHFTLVAASTQVCPKGPTTGNDATATQATVTCAATGKAVYTWSTDDLAHLATMVAGATPGTATLQLNQLTGIVPGSVKITLQSGTLLPDVPTAITIVAAG